MTPRSPSIAPIRQPFTRALAALAGPGRTDEQHLGDHLRALHPGCRIVLVRSEPPRWRLAHVLDEEGRELLPSREEAELFLAAETEGVLGALIGSTGAFLATAHDFGDDALLGEALHDTVSVAAFPLGDGDRPTGWLLIATTASPTEIELERLEVTSLMFGQALARADAERRLAAADADRHREFTRIRSQREAATDALPATRPGMRLAWHVRRADRADGDVVAVRPWGSEGDETLLLIAHLEGPRLGLAWAWADWRRARDSVGCRSHPTAVLAALNAWLLAPPLVGVFATALVATHDARAGMLRFASAGHAPALVRHAGSPAHTARLDGASGLALGRFPDARWDEGTVALADGDALLLHSAGVTELASPDGRLFGHGRLESHLARSSPEASFIVDSLAAELEAHAAAGSVQADRVALAITIAG